MWKNNDSFPSMGDFEKIILDWKLTEDERLILAEPNEKLILAKQGEKGRVTSEVISLLNQKFDIESMIQGFKEKSERGEDPFWDVGIDTVRLYQYYTNLKYQWNQERLTIDGAPWLLTTASLSLHWRNNDQYEESNIDASENELIEYDGSGNLITTINTGFTYSEDEGTFSMLSKENFDKYFVGDDLGQWMWNCQVISPLIWLKQLWVYQDLIRRSIIIDGDDFLIKIPLWEPWAAEYKVNIKESSRMMQLNIRWEGVTWVSWKDQFYSDSVTGLNALFHAYWQRTTGRENFDLMRLEWGTPWLSMLTLLWEENIEVIESVEKSKTSQNRWFFWKKLWLSLVQFADSRNKSKQILSLWVKYIGFWKYSEEVFAGNNQINHTVTVKSVNIKDWKVSIVDPNNFSLEIVKTFDELISLTWRYEVLELTEKALNNITEDWTTLTIQDNLTTAYEEKFYAEDIPSLNAYIEWTWEKNYQERSYRWDLRVFYEWKDNKWYVKMKVVSYWEEWRLSVKIDWNKNAVNDKGSGIQYKVAKGFKIENGKDVTDKTLNAQRWRNLTNKMLHDYIRSGKTRGENPFYILNWSLFVDVKPTSQAYIDSTRVLKNIWIMWFLDSQNEQAYVNYLNTLVSNAI